MIVTGFEFSFYMCLFKSWSGDSSSFFESVEKYHLQDTFITSPPFTPNEGEGRGY